MILAPITAIAGTIAIGLLAYFVVRRVMNEAKMKSTITKQIQQDYELPYNLTMDHDKTQNELPHIEKEETYEEYGEYETYEGMYAEYDRNGS